MTTPIPWEMILQVRDLETLTVVSRVLEAQRTAVESQLAQLQDIQQVVERRMKDIRG